MILPSATANLRLSVNSTLDQLSIQLYYFMQSPWSKVVLGVLFVVLIFWGIMATRQHAVHYAKEGAKFGATSSLIMLLAFAGFLAYLFVDKVTLSEIAKGKRPLTDIPALVDSSLNRFRFVLGASTDNSISGASSGAPQTASQVMVQINKLSVSERQQLQLQMCRQLLQQLPAK